MMLRTGAPAAVLWEGGVRLLLTGNGTVGYGNELGNLIDGNEHAQTLNGLGGNDVLTGGGGADTFQLMAGGGWDIVTDFQAGLDRIHLARFEGFETASKVLAALRQVGNHVVLDLGNGQGLTFLDIQRSAFSAQDFNLPPDPVALRLTFADEFDALSWSHDGSSGTWRTTYGSGGRTLGANNEQQYYSDATEGVDPFRIQDGQLVITAAPSDGNPLGLPYTSGLINTRESVIQTYGYFEARMKLPEGPGWWPAFWMLPATGTWPPELDIMESFGRGDNRASFTVHIRDGVDEQLSPGVDAKMPDLFSAFHTFAVSWLPDEVRWFVDGVEVASMATPREMNVPMYTLLNMAVTSKYVGGTAEMVIDHVRAYQYDDATIAAHSDRPDMVVAHADTTLSATGYNLILSGPGTIRGTGNALGNILQAEHAGAAALYGLDGVDSLMGGAGNDTLDGGTGADVMLGGDGNDTYHVDSAFDRVKEYAGKGIDTVYSTVGHTLADNVENLVLVSASTYIAGHGNALNNHLTAGGGGSRLNGFEGNDTLIGSALYDSLVGGTGADLMIGGGGNDIYEVDNVKDLVVELANGGFETVRSSVSYALTDNVENLILTGATANLQGIGNELGNRITASDLGSRLFGRAGNDALVGGAGSDLLDGGVGKDTLTGGAGDDRFVFRKADLAGSTATNAPLDLITDFAGIGAAGGDVVMLQGFAAGATLVLLRSTSTTQTYEIREGTQAVGRFNLQMTGGVLGGDDVVFGRPPELVGTGIADVSVGENAPFQLDVAGLFRDLDGDALSLTVSDLPSWLVFNNGVFTGTPRYGDVGSVTLTVTAQDRAGSEVSDSFVLEVLNTNDAPVLTNPAGAQSAIAGHIYRYALPADHFVDPNPGDTITLKATGMPVGVSFDPATGVFSGMPVRAGTSVVTVTATDSFGEATSHVFSIVVAPNAPPIVAAPAADQSSAEDAPWSFTLPADTFADDNGVGILVFTATLENGDPLPAWMSFDPATQTFSGTPPANFNGGFAIRVSVKDTYDQVVSDSFILTITPVNDAPVALSDVLTTQSGAVLAIPFASLTGNDTDLDGDALTVVAVVAGSGGSVAINNGQVFFTPTAGFVGAGGFTYTLSDNSGGSATGQVAVVVVDPNEPQTAQYAAFGSGNDVIDFGAAARPLTINAGGGDDLVTGGSGKDNINGGTGNDTIIGGLGQDAMTGGAGDDSFVFRKADLLGSMDVNAALDRVSDFTGAGVAGGDLIVLRGFAEGATLVRVAVTNVVHTYEVREGTEGVGRFTVSSAAGPLAAEDYVFSEAPAPVAIPDAPPTVAAPVADQSSAEDTPWSFTLPAGTFADDNGAGALILSAALGNGDPLPAWMSFDPATQTFSGTPPANFNGGFAIRVTAKDAQGQTVSDSFALTVTPVNDAPVAVSDTVSAQAGTVLAIPFASLTGNDTDPDGDALTVVAVAAGSGGSVAINNGQVFFTPTAGFSGAGGFTYTLSDNNGGSATGQVAVVVAAASEPQTAQYVAFGSGNDVIDYGSATRPMTINAGGGDDLVISGSGKDNINGGTGNDTIIGGLGQDAMTGGAGDDSFVFRKADLLGTTVANAPLDRVSDFTGAGVAGGDLIVLRGFAEGATLVRVAVTNVVHTYEVREGTEGVGRFTVSSAAGPLAVGDYIWE